MEYQQQALLGRECFYLKWFLSFRLCDYYFSDTNWGVLVDFCMQSVGFTAAPLFLIGMVWFVGFGVVLLLIACYVCCCRRKSYSYSRTAYALSLILLVLFACAAM